MRNLFALLVAINNYHQPEILRDLAGCLNDLNDMNQFLEAYCKRDKNIKFHKKLLKNEKATRQAVIDGFKLFEGSQNGDVCFFFFSGHGAQIDSPKEFWNESDTKLEALVCHVEKGNDNLLIDKELSFLISKAQEEKDVHFIVITDSCHSGSNTKDISFNVRSGPPNLNSREIDSYLGREHYSEIKNDDGEIVRLSSPLGRQFKLSACASSELAKEKIFEPDQKIRGVLTYSILEVLKSNGYNLSYVNLASKVKIKVQSLVKDQSPRLETIAVNPQERNRVFLNGLLDGEQPTFQVSHNHREGRWEINVGSIYGLSKNDIVVLLDGRQQVEIIAVQNTFSILNSGTLQFNPRNEIISAIIIPRSRNKLKLGFSSSNKGINDNDYAFLLDILDKSPVIELTGGGDLSYVIRVIDDTLALTHPESYIPVFSRIHGQKESQARLFLKIVEQIAEWHHILSISNPNSQILESEVEIRFSAVEKPYIAHLNLIDSLPAKLIEDWQEDNVFRYHFSEEHPSGPWHTPAFRLSLTNTSKIRIRIFWVSVLYCGTGYTVDETGRNYSSTSFSITNQFLEKEELKSSGTVKLVNELNRTNEFKSVELESIQLSILDDYFDRGYNEIKDTIKIFVSTEEIDTSPFNMLGVPIDVEDVAAPRPAGTLPPLMPSQSDWRTFEIPVTIIRPRDEGILRIGQDKSFYGLTIVGHTTFSARIILSTMEEFIRSTGLVMDDNKKYIPRPEILYGKEFVCPISLTNGLGDVEGCSVIEFYRTEGAKFRKDDNEENPLIFRIGSNISTLTDAHIVLAGYLFDQRAYFSLGTMNENREIKIHNLPSESPSMIDGLGNSIKLFLLNMKSGFEIPSLIDNL